MTKEIGFWKWLALGAYKRLKYLLHALCLVPELVKKVMYTHEGRNEQVIFLFVFTCFFLIPLIITETAVKFNIFEGQRLLSDFALMLCLVGLILSLLYVAYLVYLSDMDENPSTVKNPLR